MSEIKMNELTTDVNAALNLYIAQPNTAQPNSAELNIAGLDTAVLEKVQWQPLGNGLINQTLLIDNNGHKFVLQRINQQVFPDPNAVVDNAMLINQCLSAAGQSYPLISIAPLKSLHGNFLEQISGQYWRAFEFVAGSCSIEAINDPVIAHDAASAFARFSCALSPLNPALLKDVIPNFHDVTHRLASLHAAVALDKVGRVASVQTLLAQLNQQQDFIASVLKTIATLPLRVTHNDTKINNLLFNAHNKPLAVIDLDTCMAGYLLHDFGDMVRSCCSSLSEDDANIASMTFKLDIYQALYQGYLAGAQGELSASELASLPMGARLMPLLLTMRFLTDYLDGDNYFATEYSDHNLVRANNQFKLYQLTSEQLNCNS